jgi:hypothetical protein
MKLKQIVGIEIYRRPHTPKKGATVEIVLECGHKRYYKKSAIPKVRAFCRECR